MSALTATGRLTRLALRRDRVMVPLWVLGIVVILTAGIGRETSGTTIQPGTFTLHPLEITTAVTDPRSRNRGGRGGSGPSA